MNLLISPSLILPYLLSLLSLSPSPSLNVHYFHSYIRREEKKKKKKEEEERA